MIEELKRIGKSKDEEGKAVHYITAIDDAPLYKGDWLVLATN